MGESWTTCFWCRLHIANNDADMSSAILKSCRVYHSVSIILDKPTALCERIALLNESQVMKLVQPATSETRVPNLCNMINQSVKFKCSRATDSGATETGHPTEAIFNLDILSNTHGCCYFLFCSMCLSKATFIGQRPTYILSEVDRTEDGAVQGYRKGK